MNLAAPTTPAEWLCLAALLPVMIAATWECLAIARAHARQARARDAALDEFEIMEN
jgi:hypothetical protein